MAQAATMGPPSSPRETRRSGRRSAPSASTSTSKSPDSDPIPRQKDVSHRPSLPSSNSSGRTKRPKQEDVEESVDDRKNGPAPSNSSTASTHGTTSSRTKRKAKEKDKQVAVEDATGEILAGRTEDPAADAPEEEEQGITRCVCGSTGEDDPDAGEFMVQCETCKVWQHGLCMGYESEDQLHDDDYYCEQCRPELHTELPRKLSKRPRHPSANSHNNSTSAPSRLSRSHSPSHLKQPSKRRNTMNSRDAAFDESLKEIIEATAAEAAAAHDGMSVTSNGNGHLEPEEDTEPGPSNRKKRKRIEDDAIPKKRTRSASSASDHPVVSTVVREETPVNGAQSKAPSQAPIPATKASGRHKRGSRKSAIVDNVAPAEGEDGAPAVTKRQGNNTRAKTSNAPKRPPISHIASSGPGSSAHEHGTRRNPTNGVNGHTAGSSTAEASRAYRNSHAYAVSQQPLFTSWNLPDYLAHLEEMLPTDTPRPLEVRAGTTSNGGAIRGESIERTMERGVRVKWPSKRMSVGDMNKRVRALVEWVGREQASALDRGRRREALEKAFREEVAKTTEHVIGDEHNSRASAGADDGNVAMILDREAVSESPVQEKNVHQETRSLSAQYEANSLSSSSTMKLMEELMEELIGFQERFGPGAKSRERERRLAAVS